MGLRDIRRFVEIVERLLTRWGYSHTDAKVYAYLLLSEEPLTINDLAELTNLSRSSISVSLSKLTRDYMVSVRKVGKTKYFSPIPAFLEKFLEQPREMLEKEVLPLEAIVEKLLEEAESEEYREKLFGILKDLKNLQCVLEEIIKIETEKLQCLKGEGPSKG